MAPSEPPMRSFLGRVLVGSTETRSQKDATARMPPREPAAAPRAGIGMSVPHMAAKRGDTSASEYCAALRQPAQLKVT